MNYNFLKKIPLTILAFSLPHLANAEITIDGSMQWHYIAKDPGTTVTGASDDYMHSDNKVNFTFTNKTDSGLTISMFQTIRSNGTEAVGTAESDGNSFSVEGGFGSISFGNTGGIGDSLSPTAADLIGPGSTDGKAPQFYSSTGSLTSQQASLINIIDAENNITYTLPTMGGLTLGASYKDAGQGAAENADETVVAGSYEFTSGAVNGTIVYANNSISGANAGDSSLNSTSLGFTVSSGPFTAIVARAEDDQSASVTTEVNDYGLSYAVDDALTLAAAGTEVDESVGGETLSVTSVSAKYTIVSGLDAYLTYSDYDYAAGTSGATADDGSVTILSLEATF
jgi:hypothetical protein